MSLVPTLIPKELQILKSVLLTHSLDQMKAFRLPTVNSTFLLLSTLESDRELPHMAPGDSPPSEILQGAMLKDLVRSPSQVESYIRLWSLLLPMIGDRSSFSATIPSHLARDYYSFLRYVRPLLRDISVRIALLSD